MKKKIVLVAFITSLVMSVGCFAYFSHKQSIAEKSLGNFAKNTGYAFLSNSLSSADMVTLMRDLQNDGDDLSNIKLTKWITTSIFGVAAIGCGATLFILKRKDNM